MEHMLSTIAELLAQRPFRRKMVGESAKTGWTSPFRRGFVAQEMEQRQANPHRHLREPLFSSMVT